jgi:hypothetical protein
MAASVAHCIVIRACSVDLDLEGDVAKDTRTETE